MGNGEGKSYQAAFAVAAASCLAVAAAVWGVKSLPPGGWNSLLAGARNLLPPGPHLAGNLAYGGGAVLLAGLLFLLYDALGLEMVRWMGTRPRGGTPARFACVFSGYAAVSLVLLGTATLGLWTTPGILLTVLGLAIAAGPSFRSSSGFWLKGAASVWRDSPVPARLALLAAVACLLPLAASPETHIDAFQYNLGFPRQVLVTHRLFGREIYMGWGYPLMFDFPNALPLAVGLDATAKLLRPAMGLAGILALVRAMGVRMRPAVEIWTAWLALLSLPLNTVFLYGKNDGLMAGGLAALSGVLLGGGALGRRGGMAVLALGGVLAGILAAGKYTIWPVLACLGVAVFFGIPSRNRLRGFPLFAAAAAVPCLPWALRSYFYLDDPAYPLGTLYLHPVFSDPDSARYAVAQYASWMREKTTRSELAREAMHLAAVNGLFVLAAAPFMVRSVVRGLRALLLSTAVGLVVVVVSFRLVAFTSRYAVPVFATWNAAAAPLLVAFLPRPVLAAVAITAGISSHAGLWMRRFADMPGAPLAEWVAGRKTAGEYRAGATGVLGEGVRSMGDAIARAGSPGRVLAIGEGHCMDIPVRVMFGGLEVPFVYRAVSESANSERLAVKFRQADIRWIMYNQPTADWGRYWHANLDWTREKLRRYESFARGRLELVSSPKRCDQWFGCIWAYRVAREPLAGPSRRILFLPGIESLLVNPSLALHYGDRAIAVRGLRRVRAVLPNVAWLDGLLADALLASSKYEESCLLAGGAAREGLLDRRNLLVWALAAGKAGRCGEAREALARAARAYPDWKDRIEEIRRAGGCRP